MKINVKVTFLDYFYRGLYLTYSRNKLWTGFMTIMGLFILIHPLIKYLGTGLFSSRVYFDLFFGIGGILYPIGGVYFKAKKHFKTFKPFDEIIEYDFASDRVKIKGETFNIEYFWPAIYEFKQTKKWFFLYFKEKNAFWIPKRCLTQNEITYLGNLVSELKIRVNN